MRSAVRLLVLVVILLCACCASAQSDDLASKSARGKELMAAGNFDAAIPVYEDLVKALPGNPGPMMNLGLALHMAGREQEAIEQFQRVLKLQPAHLPARLFLGAAYLGMKQPAKAVPPLTAVVRAQPENQEAQFLLGEAYLSVENYRAAESQYERLSKADPGNPKVWSGLGRSYEGLAGRSFAELEKSAPESGYWLALIAEARATANQLPRAFYFYRQAIQKAPSLRGVHSALAEIYRKSGHEDWASAEDEKERQLPPLDCPSVPAVKRATTGNHPGAAAARRRARDLECAFWGGRYGEVTRLSEANNTTQARYWRTRAYNALARDAFSRLVQLPPSAEVHELLAKIHYGQKNYREAAKDWQEALKLSPGNPYYQQNLAIALSASTDYDAAVPLLHDLLARSPDSEELNYWLGYALLGMGRPEEAVPYLEKAVARDPTVLQGRRDLARAYLRVGDVDKAVPHLKAALPLDEDGTFYYQLARAYHKAGEKDLEKQMLAKFREIQASAAVEKQNLEKTLEITPP